MPDYRSLIPEGAIAQLGERLLCKQEVVGSIPSGSTRLDEMPCRLLFRGVRGWIFRVCHGGGPLSTHCFSTSPKIAPSEDCQDCALLVQK